MAGGVRRAAIAERAARAGGVVARDCFRSDLDVETKDGKTDFVTAADRDAQRQVIATIREAFPDTQLVCEEESMPAGTDIDLRKTVPETGRAWVVDPIDGTSNYVRGIDFWATSVAAVTDGRPVAAATYLPAEGDIYAAGPESVARNDASMAVSERTDPGTFAVSLIGGWPSGTADSRPAPYTTAGERFGEVRRMGSMQGALALVAAGSLEAAVTPTTPAPWDAVAGVHLVRQAGGTATDVEGNRWTPGSEGLVVSNGAVHDCVRSVTRQSVDPDSGPTG